MQEREEFPDWQNVPHLESVKSHEAKTWKCKAERGASSGEGNMLLCKA